MIVGLKSPTFKARLLENYGKSGFFPKRDFRRENPIKLRKVLWGFFSHIFRNFSNPQKCTASLIFRRFSNFIHQILEIFFCTRPEFDCLKFPKIHGVIRKGVVVALAPNSQHSKLVYPRTMRNLVFFQNIFFARNPL